ncbi:hypothetical protein [Spirosoma sp.]|nr:hypothetical protein [Spirosoma sp.]MCX6213786.1 hypothetical protein [Spirosoma sp.]
MKRFQLKEIKVSSRMTPAVVKSAGKSSTGGGNTGGSITTTTGGD